jgi:hypothetical protein
MRQTMKKAPAGFHSSCSDSQDKWWHWGLPVCISINKPFTVRITGGHQSKTQQPSSICLMLSLSYGYLMVPMALGTVTSPSIQNIAWFQEQIESSLHQSIYIFTFPLFGKWIQDWATGCHVAFEPESSYWARVFWCGILFIWFLVSCTMSVDGRFQPVKNYQINHYTQKVTSDWDKTCLLCYIWITNNQPTGTDGSRNQTLIWAWLDVSNRRWSNELNLKQKTTWCLYRA